MSDQVTPEFACVTGRRRPPPSSNAVSSGSTTPPSWQCLPDPQPEPGDRRGCYVACWSSTPDSGGACNVVITAAIKNPQPPGCGAYNGNPDPTSQAFLDVGVTPLTPRGAP